MSAVGKTPDQQASERAKALIDKLFYDKTSLGQGIRKEAKAMFPEIVIPEDHTDAAVAPIRAEVDEVKTQLKAALDRIATREKADDDLRAENDLSVKVNAAVREFGLTDSGRAKMLDRMKETGNVYDAQAAAAYVAASTPKVAPTTSPSWMPEQANLFGTHEKDDERFKALHADPRKYMDDTLREFARDPDKFTAETFGTA